MTALDLIVGESLAVVALRRQLAMLLGRPVAGRGLPPILIQGETGTGKGLVAQVIHQAGSRRGAPFVDLNCAAIPETLLEAELFGFEQGAFTDAQRAKPGLFQTAHRGLLFLDEIGLMPPALQSKLLKAIEDRAVRRLGATQSEPTDVWIVAASSVDLKLATADGRFRQDLYHRLAVVTLTLPPLRERGGDVVMLAERFLHEACSDYGVGDKTLTPDARTALLRHSWPGNVRELANVMKRVALLSENDDIDALALDLSADPPASPAQSGPVDEVVAEVERAHLEGALRATDWNVSRAAARLGLPRNTLRYRIKKHGLSADSPSASDEAELAPTTISPPEESGATHATLLTPATEVEDRPTRSTWRRWLAAAVLVPVGLAIAIFGVGQWTADTAGDAVTRLVLPLASEQSHFVGLDAAPSFALSPDGRTLVYGADATAGEPLYRRTLDSLQHVPISGTEGGMSPFFSFDGRWVGFYVPGQAALKKVSLSGGAPITLAATTGAFYGATWGPDDTIVFASAGSAGLAAVLASGADLRQLTTLTDDALVHAYPQFLPGGHHVLAAIHESGEELPRIGVVSTVDGHIRQLNIWGRSPHYIQRGPTGYLVYGQVNGLLAVPFDPETLQVGGVAVSVLSPIHTQPPGAVYVAFSEDGTLVYAEPALGGYSQPAWVDPDGEITPFGEPEEALAYQQARLSPDGHRAVFSLRAQGLSQQLVLHDFETNERFPLTSVGSNVYPVWSPDGLRIAFSSNRTGQFQIYVTPADGSGTADKLFDADQLTIPVSWSPDGETLFFYSAETATRRDVHAYSFEDGNVTPVLSSSADERASVVSPDGHWLAYLSDESGTHQLYVASLPALDVRRQVSRSGAAEPVWAPTGDELFYRSRDATMVRVSFRSTPQLEIGREQVVFDDPFRRDEFLNPSYDVGPDGRFLMLMVIDAPTIARLQVVLGFADEVGRQFLAQN